MPEEQQSLRDHLEAAFEVPEASTAVADTRSDPPRDESGKYAKQDAAAKPAEPVEVEKVERPSSWKKDYWEKYDKLDPDLRGYILQRENEYKAGLGAYNNEVKAAKALKEAIDPFMADLQRHNIEPSTWIRNLGNAHQTLALGSPQAKMQMFAQLARDYGVDLRVLAGNGQQQAPQMDPTIQYLAQNLNGLQQQWQQFQTQQQAAEQQSIQETIQGFSADVDKHPHFEAVRETMAGLLQSGMAQNLQEAYDRAVWMAPEVREKVLAAQQQQSQQSRLEQQKSVAAKARANAVSPRSVTPGAQVNGSGKKGLRDQLADQFDDLAGRV
jgi:hypothetical protein